MKNIKSQKEFADIDAEAEKKKTTVVKTVKSSSKVIKKKAKSFSKNKAEKELGVKKRMTSRFNKLRLKPSDTKGILYVGHLPRGFDEKELKGFFS